MWLKYKDLNMTSGPPKASFLEREMGPLFQGNLGWCTKCTLILFIFTPIFRKISNLTCAYFSDGLVQPPTRMSLEDFPPISRVTRLAGATRSSMWKVQMDLRFHGAAIRKPKGADRAGRHNQCNLGVVKCHLFWRGSFRIEMVILRDFPKIHVHEVWVGEFTMTPEWTWVRKLRGCFFSFRFWSLKMWVFYANRCGMWKEWKPQAIKEFQAGHHTSTSTQGLNSRLTKWPSKKKCSSLISCLSSSLILPQCCLCVGKVTAINCSVGVGQTIPFFEHFEWSLSMCER